MKAILRQKKLIYFLFVTEFLQAIFLPGSAMAQTNELFYPDSEVPLILARSSWANSASLNSLLTWVPQNKDFPSDWQTVERIIVHDTGCDTANSSCNNNINPIATIQGIYRFHAVTRGWGDIGYNYIIDQQGRIYEGRLGGNGSRGAHTYYDRLADNFNYGSVGIVLLGNYGAISVPDVMEKSLERLIGWLAAVNNLDPQGTKSSLIWNLSKGGFATPYTGPVVAGHRDVEPGNPDPAMLDLAKVRQEAGQFKIKYQGLAYQAENSPKIYQLSGGARKVFETADDFAKQGGVYQKSALAQSQLDLFSESRFLKYPDGSLLQISGSPAIYLIDGGKKRNLSVSPQQFAKLGFAWGNVKEVAADELISYVNGLDIVYGADKEMIKDDQGRVYLIENGRKRWVTSGQLFKILRFQWKKVKDKGADFAAKILDGKNMSYPSGTLVKGEGASVYLIENGQKREFLSIESFSRLGYARNKILSITNDELAQYLPGNFVSYKDGTIVKAKDNPTIYQISGGQKKYFVSAEQFTNLGNKWGSVLAISGAELERYPLAGNMTYPDGTAVQKKGEKDVYRIEGGTAKLVPDAATFKKLKLSWSKIVKITGDEFNKLFGSVASAAALPTEPNGTNSSQPSTEQPALSASQPSIRVAIWDVPSDKTEIIFSGSGAYDVYDKNGKLIAAKSGGEKFSINNSADVFVKLVPKQGTILEAVSYIDLANWKTGLNYNKFRGNLELTVSPKTKKVWLVNELPLEEYLKGVAETSQGLAGEYLKTMSVAARTYAYYYLKQGGKYGNDEVYHITNTTSDQLYKGYSREQYASDIVSAAQATFGEIVIYNSQPIVTAYSSGAAELMTNGSKSACSVWGGKYCQAGYEYLSGGVKDPATTSYSLPSCGASGNHCVGLSGAGTRQLAALGKMYKEILTYYYPGTSIQKLY